MGENGVSVQISTKCHHIVEAQASPMPIAPQIAAVWASTSSGETGIPHVLISSFTARLPNRWLVSGNVTINGTVSVNGHGGWLGLHLDLRQLPRVAGPFLRRRAGGWFGPCQSRRHLLRGLSLDARNSYTRSKGAMEGGLKFHVEWSDNLNIWHREGVTETVLSDDGKVQSVKALVPRGEEGTRFVRLAITR